MQKLGAIIKDYGLVSKTTAAILRSDPALKESQGSKQVKLEGAFVCENFKIQDLRSESDTTQDEIEILQNKIIVPSN